jgi:hypothetical protein
MLAFVYIGLKLVDWPPLYFASCSATGRASRPRQGGLGRRQAGCRPSGGGRSTTPRRRTRPRRSAQPLALWNRLRASHTGWWSPLGTCWAEASGVTRLAAAPRTAKSSTAFIEHAASASDCEELDRLHRARGEGEVVGRAREHGAHELHPGAHTRRVGDWAAGDLELRPPQARRVHPRGAQPSERRRRCDQLGRRPGAAERRHGARRCPPRAPQHVQRGSSVARAWSPRPTRWGSPGQATAARPPATAPGRCRACALPPGMSGRAGTPSSWPGCLLAMLRARR